MNFIDSIFIEGFWGNHKLKIPLHDDVNFLIGPNGSGKTTVINLIAAVLTADFDTLDRYDFDKVTVRLRSGRSRPRVEVVKKTEKLHSFPSIGYQIFDAAKSKPVVYSLSEMAEQYAIRNLRHLPRNVYQQRLEQLSHTRGLVQHLNQLVNVRWLSVNRADSSRTVKEEQGFESTVDQKLIELTQKFAIYFGSLSGTAEKEIQKYQKMFFVSLIPSKTEKRILFDDKSLDLEKEKAALQEVYQRFKVDASEYSDRLNEYIRSTVASFDRVKKDDTYFQHEDIINIIGIWRIHDLVQKWEQLTQTVQKIYAPRDNFLTILNGLLQRKSLFLTEKNELWVETQSGKKFPVTMLSSGEKQLLIILGEALLQTDEKWIYIADEPELSLHVIWQEKLIRSIRNVNSNAQIIVATHSPDIVSQFDEKAFDMEDFLQ